jgi:hypothetical protein
MPEEYPLTLRQIDQARADSGTRTLNHMQASRFWWFLSLCGHRGSRTLELNKVTCERCRVLNSVYQSGIRKKAQRSGSGLSEPPGRRNIGEIAGTTSANLGGSAVITRQ